MNAPCFCVDDSTKRRFFPPQRWMNTAAGETWTPSEKRVNIYNIGNASLCVRCRAAGAVSRRARDSELC